MNGDSSCVAVWNSHEDAEHGVRILQQAGFDPDSLSVVGKGGQSAEPSLGYYTTGAPVWLRDAQGLFRGGLRSMLAEPALFRLPGSGPLTVAGAFASVLSEAIEEAMPGGSTGALGSALYRIGIPRDSVLRYQAELEAERFLLIVHGNQDMVHAAADVLHALEGSDVTVHTA